MCCWPYNDNNFAVSKKTTKIVKMKEKKNVLVKQLSSISQKQPNSFQYIYHLREIAALTSLYDQQNITKM